jgi:S-DNA-T family DNA segregation ATPase FtsK/SpoIIIE
MAKKKKRSQAERMASASRDKNKKKNTKPAQKTQDESGWKIPPRAISGALLLGMFVLFLVMYLNPEGALIHPLRTSLYGLCGRVGFVIQIPALLYLFIIHAFSNKRPVKMRTICMIAFVLLCGAIYHMAVAQFNTMSLLELYEGGIDETAGGVLCGGLAMLLRMLIGKALTWILLILGAILSLLGGMQITIPSIIRAIQERPRAEWEKEEEERPEPATLVVNHIANKRIAYKEQQRNRAMQEAEPVAPKFTENKASEIMRQIDTDVDMPVAAATAPVSEEILPEILDPNTEPTAEAKPKKATERTTAVKVTKKQEKVTAKEAEESAQEVAQEIAQAEAADKPQYCFPPINLLKASGRDGVDGTAEMRENAARLNETLASFKIEARIINVTRGPSVTRYEVELEKGVKLNKLTTAADDIALSLGATGVRIAAIPGKISVVGIEVPNRAVSTVSLRDVIDSQEFRTAKSKSSFAVGKDIGGSCIVGNIARLPHMLIAGTTGSGKSVCMNSIIISLLYKASPDDVKLIMVDPKMVELGIYNGIPHLLIPVVTDPKKAAGSLQWAVTEMMRRYKAMSDAGVRDLESYNGIIESQEVEGTKLPQVVVIIDELADLMLVAAKEVEESICRIAQMGRAAGIHLIIATQRPSADVITGLMKANIPSRIAFAVASAMESRIILDTQGAEKLVGKGDMLYAPIGNGKPKRVQGCFVSDPEVEAVASYVKANFVTNYDQQVMEEIERKAAQAGNKQQPTASDPEPNSDELDGDEMLPAAVDVILETGQASVSMLQRRLKLGYARAARIVDEMEEKGIVGPFQGSKPRAILVTKEQWEAMRSGGTAQMDFDDLAEEDTAVPEDF